MTTTNSSSHDNLPPVNQADFWQARYQQGETGWDIGHISTPLKTYIDGLIAANIDLASRILIPGAGNAYEASYLHTHGFTQVFIVDFAEQPLAAFAQKHPDFPQTHLIQADFFALDEAIGQFDYIIEQTFFCAIDPSRREDYAKKMQQLLKPTGELFGVLFNKDFPVNPPFGGDIDSYQQLFSRYFTIKTLAPCYNSIAPRQGTELFIRLRPLHTH